MPLIVGAITTGTLVLSLVLQARERRRRQMQPKNRVVLLREYMKAALDELGSLEREQWT